jgi:hypothetical protein
MEVSLGYHVTKFFSEFRSTTGNIVREAEDLKNRVDRVEIGVNKSNSGIYVAKICYDFILTLNNPRCKFIFVF